MNVRLGLAVLSLLLLSAPPAARAQDVVILRNGSVIEGHIVQDTEETLVIEVEKPTGRVVVRYDDLNQVNSIPAERIVTLRRQVAELINRIDKVRGLTPNAALRRTFLTPPALEALLSAAYDKIAGRDAARAAFGVEVKLGVTTAAPESQYRLARDLYSEPRLCRYDRFTRTLYVTAEEVHEKSGREARPGQPVKPAAGNTNGTGSAATLAVEDRGRIVYELLRALQDQNFAVPEAANELPLVDDAGRAVEALREGDALLGALSFAAEELKVPLEGLPDASVPFGAPPGVGRRTFAALPRYQRDLAGLGGSAGLLFVQTAYSLGGWRAVNRLYKDLPASTEQILHPEKYFGPRDTPVTVTLPLLTSALPEGFAEIHREVAGEHRLFLILRELAEEGEARAAAAGWGGDTMVVWRLPATGELLLAFFTAWDTDQDAAEFFKVWQAGIRKRYGAPKEVEAGATRYVADTIEKRVLLEQRGSNVLIVEGCPAKGLDLLEAQLWATKCERAEAPRPGWTAAEVAAATQRWQAARTATHADELKPQRAEGQIDGNRYTNPTLRFTVAKPDGWIFETGGAEDTPPLRLALPRDAAGTSASVTTGPLAAPLSAELLVHRLARRVEPWDDAVIDRALWSGPTPVAGHPGYAIAFRALAGPARLPIRLVRTAVVLGDRWYLVTLRSPENVPTALNATFDRILDSFAISK